MANFTNNSIKDTYQRILQLDNSGVVQDGTGSANLGNVHISASVLVTGSMTLSGGLTADSLTVNSVTESTTIFNSGSTQFGDTSDDQHSFSGSVVISGTATAGTFVGMVSGAAQIASEISGSFTPTSSSVAASLTSINSVTSSYVSHSASLVDLPGIKVQYTNVYTDFTNLPNATTYHGMFAHVHATGSAYFAHAGNWVKLANSSSFATDIAALDTASGSFSTRVQAQESFSSSLDATFATEAEVLTVSQSLSSSLATSIALNSTTASLHEGEITAIFANTGSYFDQSLITGSVAQTGKVQTFLKNQHFSSSLFDIYTQLRGHDIRFASWSQNAPYGEFGIVTSSAANNNNIDIEVIAYPAADNLHFLNASGSTSIGIKITKDEIRNDGNTLISSSRLFTLEPSNPLPSDPGTGSFAVTGSRLAFYNGNNWIEISGSILT